MKKIISIIVICIISVVSILGNFSNESKYDEVRVKRIIDGDTIKVDSNGKEYTVRMIGIDTPESVHPKKPVMYFGKEASNFTKEKLKNKTVYLEKDVSDTDKYGRLLRYVWLEIPENTDINTMKDKMFNAILVYNGYATIFTYPPDVNYSEELKLLQNEARNSKVGMWENPIQIGKPAKTNDKNNVQKNKNNHKKQKNN